MACANESYFNSISSTSVHLAVDDWLLGVNETNYKPVC